MNRNCFVEGNNNLLYSYYWYQRFKRILNIPSNLFADLTDRGTKKFGDDCVEDRECSFSGSYCEPKKNKCSCREEFEATNHIDKCGHRKLVYFQARRHCFVSVNLCSISINQSKNHWSYHKWNKKHRIYLISYYFVNIERCNIIMKRYLWIIIIFGSTFIFLKIIKNDKRSDEYDDVCEFFYIRKTKVI